MKLAVIIGCNDAYVAKAIVALKCFINRNPEYHPYILTSQFSSLNRVLCDRYKIRTHCVDLTRDFPNLDDRKYGRQYPVECFYHFYAYRLLDSYDFIVTIEPDMFTQRKLDIDFSRIPAIGGSELRSRFNPSLRRDLPTIRRLYRNLAVPGGYPISPGFRIYRVSALKKVGFYPKITRLYQNCLRLGVQRCGDDSLLQLYQMLNSSQFHLWPERVCCLRTHFARVGHVTVYHLTGRNKKYWEDLKGLASLPPTNRYFNEAFLAFLYNKFPPHFIKNHFPKVYRRLADVVIPFYHYPEANFGDWITPYYLKRYCKSTDYTFDYTGKTRNKIISCGSIMRLSQPGTVVYGSGIRDRSQPVQPGRIQCVRGPLTRKRLTETGCYCPPVYGDPGLLLPMFYQPERSTPRYQLGIVPHYSQYQRVAAVYRDTPGVRVIDLGTKQVETVVDQLLNCERVVSSSLHGLIVSDAYGIPNGWVKFDDNIKGDNTKFYDYFKSVNRRHTRALDLTRYRRETVSKLCQHALPVAIHFNRERLADVMFFDRQGIKPFAKLLVKTSRAKAVKQGKTK